VCLVEHAPQLYCLSDDFFVGRHIAHPALWRTEEHNRAPAYRQALTPLRSPFVRVGLEVELDADGALTLHDEDREWPDLLLGAVHFFPEDFNGLSAARLTHLFMQATEGLLAADVDVLAHPWRIFRWAKQPVPAELYGPVAQALAQTRTATEINFHGNDPAPEFLAECLSRGVKVALGSDAHWLFEVGALNPHLDLLRRVAETDDVGRFLLYP
jgi:histidinol phosphatase-like PHP family hydrolase